jgi:hypothetical protein
MAEKTSDILKRSGGILDPKFGESQEEKVKKRREAIGKGIGEAYETGKEYLGKGVEAVSDFFTPTIEQRQNAIDFYRKRGDTKRADALQAKLDEEVKGGVSGEMQAAEEPAVEEPVGIGPTPDRIYEAPGEEEDKVEAGEEGVEDGVEEDDQEDNVSETLQTFKEIPNTLDLAEQRGLVTQEFLNEIAAAKEAYNQTKKDVAQKRLWEAITLGLAQIAVGLYGQSTGLDLSGVKFEPSDWQANIDQAATDLAMARKFATDVKDVKMDELDERRDQRLREIQSARQLNADAIDRLELERRNRKEENDRIKNLASGIDTQNMSVESYIQKSPRYKNYKTLEGEIQKLYNKLPTMKKSKDREETIQLMRNYSLQMDNEVKGINESLKTQGVEGEFGNAYPPEIFAPTKGFFGGEKTPTFEDITQRSSKLYTGSRRQAGIDSIPEDMKQDYRDAVRSGNQEKIAIMQQAITNYLNSQK